MGGAGRGWWEEILVRDSGCTLITYESHSRAGAGQEAAGQSSDLGSQQRKCSSKAWEVICGGGAGGREEGE